MLSKAQRGAVTVKTVRFSDNPQLDTQKHGKINSLYGYLFGGDVSRLLLLNLGPEAKTVATDGRSRFVRTDFGRFARNPRDGSFVAGAAFPQGGRLEAGRAETLFHYRNPVKPINPILI